MVVCLVENAERSTTTFYIDVPHLLRVKGIGIDYAAPEPQNNAHSIDFRTTWMIYLLSELSN